MSNVKRLIVFSALVLAGVPAYGFQIGLGGGGNPNQGTLAPEAPKKTQIVRSVTGVVLDQNDDPIPHAIVYLKNKKTLTIKTSITNDKGSYQFAGLVPNQDYELYADVNGSKSPAKTLSGFDSREKTTLNLHIDQKPKEAEESKAK